MSENKADQLEEALAELKLGSAAPAAEPIAQIGHPPPRSQPSTPGVLIGRPPPRGQAAVPGAQIGRPGQAAAPGAIMCRPPSRGRSVKKLVLAQPPSPVKAVTLSRPSMMAPATYMQGKREAHIILSACQQRVYNLAVDCRENVFFTGGAGCGKSTLLQVIVAALKATVINRTHVAVTAPTGIAAVNINGCTLHAFAGVGLFEIKGVSEIVQDVRKSNKTFARWRDTRVLVIDEASMVSGEAFDLLEEAARILRGNNLPFGGIQLLVTGDFFQLPPISKGCRAKFAFEARSWNRCFPHSIVLEQIFRQKDQAFVNILNEIRLGYVSDKTARILMDLARPLPHTQLEPVELFALRHQVDEANRLRLAKIPGVSATYVAVDAGVSSAQVSKLTDACLAPSLLTLKAGVQVMLLKNLKDEILGEPEITSPELANGTIGIVVECFQECVQVDFSVPGGLTRRRTVTKEEWKIQDAFGNVLASRQQIPLMLSYAISIHKSQGQTLQLLRVDLGRVFEMGQTYVALSRAVSLDGLQVLNFRPSKVQADKRVVQFYETLAYACL